VPSASECEAFVRLLDQKGRENGARGVVQRHDQIERRPAGEPFVPRAVLMQHHARHRSARSLAPMRPAPLGLLQQPPRMQKRLRPRVAPGEGVVARQMLVKMLGREARIPRLVKRLHLSLAIGRNTLARRLAEPAVQQARLARFLEAVAPAPKRPLPNPQQLRRFHLTELRRLVTAQNVQKPHHPHTLQGFRPAHPKLSIELGNYRTDRALPKPDISCASDNERDWPCAGKGRALAFRFLGGR